MPELVVLAEQLLASVPGGTGRYTRELLDAMVRHAPDGWTVTAVTARHRLPLPDARMLHRVCRLTSRRPSMTDVIGTWARLHRNAALVSPAAPCRGERTGEQDVGRVRARA